MRSLSLGILLIGMVAAVSLSRATSFAPKSFPKAASEAALIVRGTVSLIYTNWAQGYDGVTRVYTFVNIDVTEVLKGNYADSTLVVREMGGEKDGIRLTIPGTAHFRRGEDTVVFLAAPPYADGSYQLRGMMMGHYFVVRGDDGQEELRGGRITPERGDPDEPAQPGVPTRWTLDAVKELIRKQGASAVSSTPAPVAPARVASKPQKEAAEIDMKASEDESSSGRPRWLNTGLGVILGSALYLLARRRKKNRKK